jgi:glutathione peroxidase
MKPIQVAKTRLLGAALRLSGRSRAAVVPADEAAGAPIDAAVTTIEGNPAHIADWRGKAVMIVNVASQCGHTAQYAALESLWQRYRERGLVILGFPCDDYGHQEPGTDAEIAEFCSVNWGVSFPMFAKLHARGPEKHPLYRELTEATPESLRGEVRWNFTKFLLDPEGHPVARFDSGIQPDSATVIDAIERALPA